MAVSFKLVFAADNIRRFTTVPSTLESFLNLLQDLYPEFFHQELTLRYEDSDGDQVSVSSEMEWQELLEQFKDQKIIKLSLVDKTPGKYFKDGPAPEVVSLQEENAGVRTEIPIADGIEDRVTKALENLFPAQKILPYNLPSFLKDVVSFETIGDRICNLDINVQRFGDTLHREAMNLMETADKKLLSRARQILYSQYLLCATNPVTLYNLACAEALLGNAVESFKWLEQSIQNGYRNLAHMCQDPDLASLRDLEQWNKVVLSLKSLVAPEPPKPVIPEKPVVPEKPAIDAKLQPDLDVLHEMGFLDDSVLIPALNEHGSIDGALSHLFR